MPPRSQRRDQQPDGSRMGVAAIDREHLAGVAVIGGRSYPICCRRSRDPRLHLASSSRRCKCSGRRSLDFELSIAQILVSLATSAVIEFVILFATRRVLAWPASALLAGNGGGAAIARRRHRARPVVEPAGRGTSTIGDRRSRSGVEARGACWRGRPLFNPSNIALVLCFMLLGSSRVNPLDLWWGPRSPEVVAVYAIILTGGLVITARVRDAGAALAFWLTFAAGTAIFAERGHCFTARWHIGPVCNGSFWVTLVTSPEILIFATVHDHRPQDGTLGTRRTRRSRGVDRLRGDTAHRHADHRVRRQGGGARRVGDRVARCDHCSSS